jgi:hypothetical protein
MEVAVKRGEPMLDLALQIGDAYGDAANALAKMTDTFGAQAKDAVQLFNAMDRIAKQRIEASITLTSDKANIQSVLLDQQKRAANVMMYGMFSPPPGRVALAPQSRVQAMPNLDIATTTTRRTFIAVSNAALDTRVAFTNVAEALDAGAPAIARFFRGAASMAGGVESLFSFLQKPSAVLARTDSGALDNAGTLANIGAVIGPIAAAVGVVQSLFGAFNASAEQAREIQRQNLDELRRIRGELQLQNRGASAVVDVRRAFAAATASGVGTPTGNVVQRLQFAEEFQRQAAKYGITVEQLDALARQYGITITNNGQIVGSALDEFAAALEIANKNIGQFAKNLDGERQRMDLLQNVNDVEQTPERVLQNQISLLERFSPAIAAVFRGIDATTEEGRRALKAALVGLVQTIVAQGVTAEQLGTFGSLEELLSVLLTMEGAFDDLADATNRAVGAMTNVPSGFKLAYRIFESQSAVTPQATPTTPQTAGTTTSGLPYGVTGMGVTPSVTIAGDVTIIAQPGETSEDAFNGWVRTARTKARAKGRPTDDWTREVG